MVPVRPGGIPRVWAASHQAVTEGGKQERWGEGLERGSLLHFTCLHASQDGELIPFLAAHIPHDGCELQKLPFACTPVPVLQSPESLHKSSSQDLLRPVDLTALTLLVKPHPWKTNFPSRNHTSMGARLPRHSSGQGGNDEAWGPEPLQAGRREVTGTLCPG